MTPVLTGTEKITKHYGFEAFYLNVKRIKRGYYEADFSRLHDNSRSLPDYELTALYFQQLEKQSKGSRNYTYGHTTVLNMQKKQMHEFKKGTNKCNQRSSHYYGYRFCYYMG